MMRAEPHEEDLNINIVRWSGATTGEDKGKQPEEGEWVYKALENETQFDLECAKEIFMEVKKTFTEASTSESQGKTLEEMDPSMITKFLETCMKLLCNNKVVKGLQELINRCTSKENSPSEPRVVKKIGKNKTRTGREMRLTTQIGEYEMDQVILDLGANMNVLPKKT